MPIREFGICLVFACGAPLVASAADYQLKSVTQLPTGLSKSVMATLNPAGLRLVGPKGGVFEIWLAKSITVKSGFTPTLNAHYPFAAGQLIGAMRILDKAEFTDFRGQEFSAGVYTLRYGMQPEDGNHIGTSELADFLLALPAKIDNKPAVIAGADQLAGQSAKSVGSTHPAIISLLPQSGVKKSAVLTHDADHDFWILDLLGQGLAGKKAIAVKLRIVAIGRSLE
ncbi:MAG: hypothetical protein ABGZ17_21895 [Planctomycetaceae bacterium]